MKKVKMLLVLSLLFVSTQIIAQNRNLTPEERAKRQTERMTQSLNLNEGQSAKVLEINKKMMERMQEARNSNEIAADNSPEDRRAFRQKFTAERNAELKKVLTEEQWAKWEEMVKERQNRGERRRTNGQNQPKETQPGS